MNTENQDFESLRRLLKLKRYEQPPPRYFNEFSGQVISRLRSAESRAVMEEPDLAGVAPWFQRFLANFEQKPVIAGVFGSAVCGLLIAAAVYTDVSSAPAEITEVQTPMIQVPAPIAVQAFADTASLAFSTNPVAARSLFDSLGNPDVQRVNANGRPFWQ